MVKVIKRLPAERYVCDAGNMLTNSRQQQPIKLAKKDERIAVNCIKKQVFRWWLRMAKVV